MHVLKEALVVAVEGRLQLLCVEVAVLVFGLPIKGRQRDVSVGSVVMSVDQSPPVGHVPVDVLTSIEELAVLNWSYEGVDLSRSQVSSVLVHSKVSLVEKMEDEHILLFVAGEYFLLLGVVEDVEAETASDVVRESSPLAVIVVVECACRLLVPILINFDFVGLLGSEQSFQEGFLVFEKEVVVLIGAQGEVPGPSSS